MKAGQLYRSPLPIPDENDTFSLKRQLKVPNVFVVCEPKSVKHQTIMVQEIQTTETRIPSKSVLAPFESVVFFQKGQNKWKNPTNFAVP